MQHQQSYGLIKMALRARICSECYQRPPGSDEAPPSEERICEKTCAIFTNLPQILRMTNRGGGEPPYGYETGIRNYVCQTCKESQTAGDFCISGLTRDCPLSRYAAEAVAVVERVVAIKRRHASGGATQVG